MIDRLKERFTATGFAYGYEPLSETHVVEISDAATFKSEELQDQLMDVWMRFRREFAQESLLFIGPDSTPLQVVQYKVGPKQAELSPFRVSAAEILSSVDEAEQVSQVAVLSVGLANYAVDNIPAGNYSYAMAA